MKILERYILAEFLKFLAIALLALTLVFIIIDVFENMDGLLHNGVPPGASVSFFLYKIPSIIGQISPVAVLLASILSLSIFSRHGEITAVKAGGVYLLRVLSPLLATGLVISGLVIVMNEYVTPAALKKVDSFKREWLGAHGGTPGREGMWFRTDNGIFNIRQADLKSRRLQGLTLYVIEKPFNIKSLVQSRLVVWQDGKWVAPEAAVWNFTPEGAAQKSEAKNLAVEGLVEPEDLASAENIQKNMGIKELWTYIRTLEADRYDATRYRIELYGKISFPLVNFIMVLVGIPFALLRSGRHSGVAVGIGLSVIIAFSYWVVFALTRALGQSGLIMPLIAAVFPDILFFAVGTLLMGHVRQ